MPVRMIKEENLTEETLEHQISKQSSDIYEEDSKELRANMEKPKTLV